MSDNHEENAGAVPAGGDGPEERLFAVPDDASTLDAESVADAPVEGSAAERAASGEADAADADDWERLAAERTADLQRLHAEYVNYKRRVDRDRDVARQRGIEAVVNDLLPVLDSIDAARRHGEVEGALRLIADELDKVAAKYGLTTFGEVGDPFDPNVHEALMHVPYDGDTDVTVVSAVMQRGAKLGDRIVRPARVGVADPQ